jgi:DNA helicase II / ATP-dependent DNA helicase PcrA
MDVSHLLDSLNAAQREAVSADPGHLLILAGAGSGKTRVLVHRIAWLLQVQQVQPWSILAVTFTNKAAREMRGRLDEMLGTPVGGMWVGTFHGLAHRFLRAHWQDAGLPQQFQILDGDDQFG